MGGGRKSKNGSSSSSRSQKTSQNTSKQSAPNKQKQTIDDQLRQCTEAQVIATKRSCFITWKECILILVILVTMATVCLLAGLAGGTAVSIQFYKEKNTVPSHRITSMDSDIYDVLKRLNKEDVQELPPLEEMETSLSNTTQGFQTSEPTIQPSLCPDGVTMGFQDWNTLKAAIHEANRLSAERFLEWNRYLSSKEDDTHIEDDVSLYYEQDVFFTICPDITLYARKGPIFINSENIVLECDGCTIEVGGSHLAFGANAKNVLVRGITFRGAQTSSLTFYHNGCDAAFEDCHWYANAAQGKSGAVADVNSTSSVVFYRCEIDDANNVAKKSPRGSNEALASSLSIRS